MNNCQDFPETVEEFMDEYKMVDTEEVYSNGTEYVPIFRMKQWFEHERNTAYPKKGKWIKADRQQYFRKHYPASQCSICGWRKNYSGKYNYCPNCGADMRESE